MPGFDNTSKNALKQSRSIARSQEHEQVELIDLFMATVQESSIIRQAMAQEEGKTIDFTQGPFATGIEGRSRGFGLFRRPIGFSDEVKSLIMSVSSEVGATGSIPPTLICAQILRQHDARVEELLRAHGMDPDQLLLRLKQ
jgi:ATP-dependent Clp protease ATP-binding subunit ClpA